MSLRIDSDYSFGVSHTKEDSELDKLCFQILNDIDLFQVAWVNHIQVAGILYLKNREFAMISFYINKGSSDDPFTVQLSWCRNNQEVGLDEILSLLAPEQSKKIIYNLDFFNRNKVNLRNYPNGLKCRA